MTTKGVIYIAKPERIGVLKHTDMYPNGFLLEFVTMLKELGLFIKFETINDSVIQYISYHRVNMIKKALDLFNIGIDTVLEDPDYYSNDFKVSCDMKPNTFDVDYLYKFLEDEIQVYNIPELKEVKTPNLIGTISYDEINSSNLDELKKIITTF